MLDADTGDYIALVPTREYDDVVEALKLFPDVKTVSRDGYTVYANAIASALPGAAQVSDRFHLVKNMIDAAQRYLAQIIPFCIVPKRKGENALGIIGKMTSREKYLLENYNKKLKVFKRVKKLQNQGKRASTVAREVGVKDSIVCKYFKLTELQPHGRAMTERDSMLNPYKPMLLDMIQAGERSYKILEVLRAAGCKSADSRIRGYITKVRRDSVDNTKAKFYRRDVCKLLYGAPEKIRDEELRNKVVGYVAANPKVCTVIMFADEFRSLLKSGDPTQLDKWNLRIKESKITELVNFVRYLESDLTAVRNAVIYPHSNGVAEGKINKLKTEKRKCYGRSGFALLKARLFLSDEFK